jgi:hypothetical protein
MTVGRTRAGSIVIVLAVIGLLVASGRGDGSASSGAFAGRGRFRSFA